MKKPKIFTCQIEPLPPILRSQDGKWSKSQIVDKTMQITSIAILLIVAIAAFSTINAVYIASKKNELQFKQTLNNEGSRNQGIFPVADQKNKPYGRVILSIPFDRDFIMKKDSIKRQFPVYVPFYFFLIGFFLVLAQRWIFFKGNRNANEEEYKVNKQHEFHKQGRRPQRLIANYPPTTDEATKKNLDFHPNVQLS
jgi:hypothetical protein